MGECFQREEILRQLKQLGSFLPTPVYLYGGADDPVVQINSAPPWRRRFSDLRSLSDAIFEFGRERFGLPVLDWIPLQTQDGAVNGLAFILPAAPDLQQRAHSVYLRGLLLSEHLEKLLPSWAFFLRCVVDIQALPSAEESLPEGPSLDRLREELALTIRAWLQRIAEQEPERMGRILAVHHLAFKSLALEDERFFEMIIHWLPFESAAGAMTLREYSRRFGRIYYAISLEEFRRLAPVVSVQGSSLINASSIYDRQLMERAAKRAGLSLHRLDARRLSASFQELDSGEKSYTQEFLRRVQTLLSAQGCTPQLSKFSPRELSAIYEEREAVPSKIPAPETSTDLWEQISGGEQLKRPRRKARLLLNYENSLIRELIRLEGEEQLSWMLRLLYIQARTLSHYPMNVEARSILSRDLQRSLLLNLKKEH